MKKLIITADDYGMSRAVNDAIDAGIAAGLITSTNVMTNMPFYQEAIKWKDNPDISVGLHWVLTCGKPVLSTEEIPTLVAENGFFFSHKEFCSKFRQRKISYGDIKKELYAQFDLYSDILGAPDYWNTHQNVHVGFGIYQLFVEVASELGICKMRNRQRVYVKGSSNTQKQPFLWTMAEPFKTGLLELWQNHAHRKGIASPDGVIVCLNALDANHPEYVFANIQWKKCQVAEYVIHPSTENDSPYFGKIVDQRIQEYKIFTAAQTRTMIEHNGMELATYSDVTI